MEDLIDDRIDKSLLNFPAAPVLHDRFDDVMRVALDAYGDLRRFCQVGGAGSGPLNGRAA